MLPQPLPQRARRQAGATEPTGLVPALVLLGFGLTALCGVAALLLLGRLPAVSPAPGAAQSPTAIAAGGATTTPVPALIQGAVWDDVCDTNAPSTPACVLDSTGRYSANGVWDASEAGLAGVLVTLGVGECPAAPVLSLLTEPQGEYRFGGLPPGAYCVSVDPAHSENVSLIPGGWSWPVPGAAVAAQVTINTAAGQIANVNFGWDRHELPATSPPASTQPPTATGQPSPTPGCSDHAAFMADVTIPDGATLLAGIPFTKTWRVLNTGSCTWDASYALLFASGEAMGSPPSTPLADSVPPGSLLDVSVSLLSPASQGPHAGAWLLRGHEGRTFGTGPDGDVPLAVRIVVTGTLPTPTPTPSAWQAAYFANRDLAGEPALTRAEDMINHDWGTNSPGPGVPADSFSARWTGAPVFDEGLYRFIVTVDDGARLYLDGELVVDEWRDASRREVVVERPLLAGEHSLRMEYYDHLYDAVVMLRWQRVGDYPNWQGEYWANPTLTGNPVMARQDTLLDFTWGNGGPGGNVPADNFSARWTRASLFEAGAYRFRVTVDDGTRLWVGNRLIIDEWTDGPVRDVTGEVMLAAGMHNVRVEFVEYEGDARVAVRWEKIPAITYPDWKAEYFANPNLQGAPALTRNETTPPDHNWDLSFPTVAVPPDNFSVRWTRAYTLEAGLYRFYGIADDGLRVRVGGQLVLDEWHASDGTATYQADVALPHGSHTIIIEYFDNAFTARVRVWWERVGAFN